MAPRTPFQSAILALNVSLAKIFELGSSDYTAATCNAKSISSHTVSSSACKFGIHISCPASVTKTWGLDFAASIRSNKRSSLVLVYELIWLYCFDENCCNASHNWTFSSTWTSCFLSCAEGEVQIDTIPQSFNVESVQPQLQQGSMIELPRRVRSSLFCK